MFLQTTFTIRSALSVMNLNAYRLRMQDSGFLIVPEVKQVSTPFLLKTKTSRRKMMTK